MEQLNGFDNVLITLGKIPGVPLQIGALLVYDAANSPTGRLEYADVKAMLGLAIDTTLPMLKCRVEGAPRNADKPYWVIDHHFNLDEHIERTVLPAPCDWAALHTIAADFHAQPLDLDKPLWQALFIENLDHLDGMPKGAVGLQVKIHHALADGKSALKIFAALHTLSPAPDAPKIFQAKDMHNPDFTPPGWWQKYLSAYHYSYLAPYRLAKNLTGVVTRLLRSDIKGSPTLLETPRTPFNTTPSADRIIGHIRIPMTRMKALQSASGCTINDIALAIIAGTLRDYLLNRDELPEASLLAGMPVDIRDHREEKLIGNQISFVKLSIFTDIEDPRARLLAIHQASAESREKNRELGQAALLDVLDNLHPTIVTGARKLLETPVTNKLPCIINVITTNVPGVPLPCYLCGAELVDYVAIGTLIPTVSLFHAISSIPAHVNISFLGCSSSLKDPAAYARSMEHSCRQLMEAWGIPE